MARVEIGRDGAGKRKRKTIYGRTRQAVAKELARLLGRAAGGELLTTSSPALSTWLEAWNRVIGS